MEKDEDERLSGGGGCGWKKKRECCHAEDILFSA